MFFKTEKEPEPTLIASINEYYRTILLNYSCCIYMLASLVVICSLMYYLSYWKQYLHLRRRRQALRRANQRLVRPHRPFAVYREHEIFRKVMRTVREYQERLKDRKQSLQIDLPHANNEFLHCNGSLTTPIDSIN